MTPLEKDIEKALCRMIGKHGGLCLKWVCPGFAGVPDRVCLLPGGHIIFVELKRPKGGKRSALQEWWSRKLEALGFLHFWVKNLEEVKALETVVIVWLTEEDKNA